MKMIPKCPFCKREIEKPEPWYWDAKEEIEDEFGKKYPVGTKFRGGYKVHACKCGAKYSYDPTCGLEEDIGVVKILHVIHNYHYDSHNVVHKTNPDYDIENPDSDLGHICFAK